MNQIKEYNFDKKPKYNLDDTFTFTKEENELLRRVLFMAQCGTFGLSKEDKEECDRLYKKLLNID